MATWLDDLDVELPFLPFGTGDLIVSVLTLVIGWGLSKVLLGAVRRGLGRSQMPPLLIEFLRRLLSALLWVLVILAALGPLGVDTAGLVGAFAVSMGLILAFGLQDSFQNFAAGAWLATTRPIRVDETVVVAGQQGKVVAVGLMATTLVTPQNVTITVPNASIYGQALINHSRQPTRRIEVDVGVAYGSDIEVARGLALTLMEQDPDVLEDPAPAVVTVALADSSINLQLRAWANTPDMWEVKDRLTNAIYVLFNEQGIEIPFPQLDVHLHKQA